jgi:hypothetical protein
MNHKGHVPFSESNDIESLVMGDALLIIKEHDLDATALINGYIKLSSMLSLLTQKALRE